MESWAKELEEIEVSFIRTNKRYNDCKKIIEYAEKSGKFNEKDIALLYSALDTKIDDMQQPYRDMGNIICRSMQKETRKTETVKDKPVELDEYTIKRNLNYIVVNKETEKEIHKDIKKRFKKKRLFSYRALQGDPPEKYLELNRVQHFFGSFPSMGPKILFTLGIDCYASDTEYVIVKSKENETDFKYTKYLIFSTEDFINV